MIYKQNYIELLTIITFIYFSDPEAPAPMSDEPQKIENEDDDSSDESTSSSSSWADDWCYYDCFIFNKFNSTD